METIKVYRDEIRGFDGDGCVVTSRPQLPTRGTPGAVGYDLRAFYGDAFRHEIKPGETQLVPTGLFFEIPPGYEVQVRSRSGLAKIGIVVVNSPATFDSDYRGQVLLILRNHSALAFQFKCGDRLAQMVFQRVPEFEFAEVASRDAFSTTERGEGRHGSTGVR